MCKYYEYETEIECAYCGKTYTKKKHPMSQMMTHMQYCPNKNNRNDLTKCDGCEREYGFGAISHIGQHTDNSKMLCWKCIENPELNPTGELSTREKNILKY